MASQNSVSPLLLILHFIEQHLLMLGRFVSKMTSCIITFYHLRSFALTPTNLNPFWFHLKVRIIESQLYLKPFHRQDSFSRIVLLVNYT